MLEQAYLSIFENRFKQQLDQQPVEEEADEEPEDDKMAAAVAIQQTADEVEDQGGKVNQQLQKAKQESEKYVNDKISQFKNK
jgi:ElaB/YqjD/DUF883 family membrane-anchored ribosome-binding protein